MCEFSTHSTRPKGSIRQPKRLDELTATEKTTVRHQLCTKICVSFGWVCCVTFFSCSWLNIVGVVFLWQITYIPTTHWVLTQTRKEKGIVFNLVRYQLLKNTYKYLFISHIYIIYLYYTYINNVHNTSNNNVMIYASMWTNSVSDTDQLSLPHTLSVYVLYIM